MHCEQQIHSKKKFKNYLIGLDIGGTNCNIGFFGVSGREVILTVSYHYKTQEINNVEEAVNDALKRASEYRIKADSACFAIAGPVNPDRKEAQMTNAKIKIVAKDVLKNTELKSVLLINDFEAIGYGVNILKAKDILRINKVKEQDGGQKACLGAGTDLGKVILFYDKNFKAYIPISSEGGHSDIVALNKEELNLVNHIAKIRGSKNPRWGHILSGEGIELIYSFLQCKYSENKYSREIYSSQNKAELISKYKDIDKRCEETFGIFTKFYARCSRNFALETLSFGGVYIAGGIAVKNQDIFGKGFLEEFDRQEYLRGRFPVFLIKNYNIGMHGAAFACLIRKDLSIRK